MNNFIKRIIPLLLIILLLSGCTPPYIDDGNAVTEGRSLTEDGKLNTVILYEEGDSTTAYDAAGIIASKIAQKEGIDRPRVKKASDGIPDDKTVITVSLSDSVKYYDYSIKADDSGLSVLAGSDAALSNALTVFISDYDSIISEGHINGSADINYSYDYPKTGFSLGDNDIAEYIISVPYMKRGANNAEFAAEQFIKLLAENTGITLKKVYEEDVGDAEKIISFRNTDDFYKYSVDVGADKTEITAGGQLAFEKALYTIFGGAETGFKHDCDDAFSEARVTGYDFVTIGSEKAVKEVYIAGTPIESMKVVYHDYGADYEGNGESEIYAAAQLCDYIKDIHGSAPELVKDSEYKEDGGILIIVGRAEVNGNLTEEELAEFGEEGVLIEVKNGNLILTGGYKRGALYAVYSFLEKYLGCRFLAPGCEKVYRNEKIEIADGETRRESSNFEYRDVSEEQMMNPEYSAKRKVNSYYHRELTAALGGSFDFVRGANAFVHTMYSLYRMSGPDVQPCLTNEEIYESTLEKVKNNLKMSPDSPVLSMTQNDVNNYCTCSECMKVYEEEGSYAGTLIRFVNRLADDIKDEYPNVKILTLAYMFSSEPTKTAPRDNVIIQYCTLDACNQDPLTDITCATNKGVRAQIDGWTAMSENTYIWLYTTAFVGEPRSKCPFMNFDALFDTYRYFETSGIKGIFNEGEIDFDSDEFGALRSYVISKLMWDRDMTRDDYRRAIEEFIYGYYGEAGDAILSYFHTMSYLAKDKHFAWAAQTNGMLDTTRLYLLRDQTDDLWTRINAVNYSDSAVKERIKALYTGYQFITRR